MRKSNLILIGAGLVYLVFVSAIPVTLRYKLSHRDFTVIQGTENYPYTHHPLKKSERIILEDLPDCTIIPSDSMFLEIENRESNTVVVIERGDTLFVGGRQTAQGIPQKIRIYLPTNRKITASRCTILLRGSAGQKGMISYEFALANSRLFTKAFTVAPQIAQSFHELMITGSDSSVLDLQGIIHIDKLIVSDVAQFSYGKGFGSADVNISYHNKKVVESRGHEGSMMVTSTE